MGIGYDHKDDSDFCLFLALVIVQTYLLFFIDYEGLLLFTYLNKYLNLKFNFINIYFKDLLYVLFCDDLY